jgi:signal transduction histidine kinase
MNDSINYIKLKITI